MITAQHLEVRAGARLLMENVSFRVASGDKIGLVERNGADKTTLTRILAGEALPASGKVMATGEVGYLPQDPRIGNPEVFARDRHERAVRRTGVNCSVRPIAFDSVSTRRRVPTSASRCRRRAAAPSWRSSAARSLRTGCGTCGMRAAGVPGRAE